MSWKTDCLCGTGMVLPSTEGRRRKVSRVDLRFPLAPFVDADGEEEAVIGGNLDKGEPSMLTDDCRYTKSCVYREQTRLLSFVTKRVSVSSA